MNVTANGQSYNFDITPNLKTDALRKQLAQFVENAKKDGTVKIQIKTDGSNAKKSITNIKTATGELVQITRRYRQEVDKATGSSKWKEVKTSIDKVSQTYKELETTAKKAEQAQRLSNVIEQNKRLTKELKETTSQAQSLQKQLDSINLDKPTKQAKTFGDAFTDTFAKMASFNLANVIQDQLFNSLSEVTEITEQYNDATTELQKVSDLAGESLQEYADKLGEVGEKLGRTKTEMVESATVYKRTGSSDMDASKLAEISELYKNVADSKISSATASSYIVSQMKAFKKAGDDEIATAQHIVDSTNAVANNFAVSTDDIQEALIKSGSALATAGNNFDQTVSLVTAGTEVMQGQASMVGNGLRTIAVNIANLANKSNEFVGANGKVRVALKDTNGDVRSTFDILKDLSAEWDNLSTAEKNSIAVTIAGKHKIPSSCSHKTYLIARTSLQHYNYNIRMKYA
jgi:TP901 family phage tail tape measure protein